jgi:hypothetical protein
MHQLIDLRHSGCGGREQQQHEQRNSSSGRQQQRPVAPSSARHRLDPTLNEINRAYAP